MALAEWRDLFIVIFSILGIGATILISVIAVLTFRKVRAILDSGKATMESIRVVTSTVSQDIVKPLGDIAGAVQGVRRAVEFISRFSRRKEEERHGG